MLRVRQQIECTDEIISTCRKESKAAPVGVAILDTGISLHPDFEGRILGFQDFVKGSAGIYDDSGHGTHVAGCIGGSGKLSNGRYKGICPFCNLVIGKVLDHYGNGKIDDMCRAVAWMIAHHKQYHIRVLNISIGAGHIEETARMQRLIETVDSAWDEGLVVVCAAGNTGPAPMSLSPLGYSKKIITVGCHEGGFFPGRKSLCENFSGRGPVPAGIKKPDIVAPGTDIISCNAGYRQSIYGSGHGYVKKTGTSMATPIVSGACALLLQRYPELSNEQVKCKISYSATDLHEPWTKQGWGMINIKSMMQI